MAFNIARAVDALGAPGRARARWASVRTRLINVPARIAATGHRLVLHLPRDLPWAQALPTSFTATTYPPATHPTCPPAPPANTQALTNTKTATPAGPPHPP